MTLTQRLFILTGASRGLGAALAEQVLAPGVTLLAIARGADPAHAARAEALGAQWLAWPRDLAHPGPVARDLDDWLRTHDPADIEEATLVNNAGVLGHVGPVDRADDAQTSAALRVGLEAAVLLTAAFLRATRGWPARAAGRCKVLNISSGLGRRAMAGSAVYCAAKAGLDHFTRAVALDEAHRGDPVRIVSLAPGVIDTDMQAELRGAPPEGFPDRSAFVRLREGGHLTSPAEAAARVLAFLQRPDFGREPVADVRDA